MKRHAAFTLIEVLAVVLLTGIVISIALSFYLDLSRASNRAAEQTRGTRRAATLLDRIARDFAGTRLPAQAGRARSARSSLDLPRRIPRRSARRRTREVHDAQP